MEKFFYLAAISIFFILLFVYLDLLQADKIGSSGFITLLLGTAILAITVAKLPDVYEVSIGGNTIKTLKKEVEKAEDILNRLSELKRESFIMQMTSLKNTPSLTSSIYQTGITRAEGMDLFTSIYGLIPRTELKGDVLDSALNAAKTIMLRQHLILEQYFAYSDKKVSHGKISRVRLLPLSEYETMTSKEIDSEVARMISSIEKDPKQSINSDEHTEYRKDAANNYKEISDLYHLLVKTKDSL